MLTARFYNRVLRFIAFLCFLIGVGGFAVDAFIRLDYVVIVFGVSGALTSALIWLVVWVGMGALFMVIAYAAERLETVFRDTEVIEDEAPTD
jgi:hypothetical protein